MNLGQQDYHVLTTLFQENLKESESHAVMEGKNKFFCYFTNELKSKHKGSFQFI